MITLQPVVQDSEVPGGYEEGLAGKQGFVQRHKKSGLLVCVELLGGFAERRGYRGLSVSS